MTQFLTAYHFEVPQFSQSRQGHWLYPNLIETSKNMFTFLCCFYFHLITLSEAREIHFGAHSSFRFTNFMEHKSHYLDGSRHSEIRVLEFVDCAMKCLTTSPCISLNMASSKDGEEMFWCQLLLADMFNNSQNFNENSTSLHLSKWVSL